MTGRLVTLSLRVVPEHGPVLEIVVAAMTARRPVQRAEEERPRAPEPRPAEKAHLDEKLVAQEASAAAAEAAMIGGAVRPEVDDTAMGPVYQAGGGEQEGWEAAEEELIENASHGDGGGDPLRDAMPPELESDVSGAVYGEADRILSTEVVEDPSADDTRP